MSQARKCDLCFDFYDAHSTTSNPNVGTILRGRFDDSCHNIDVCPTCRITLGLEPITCECSVFRSAVIQLLQRVLKTTEETINNG